MRVRFDTVVPWLLAASLVVPALAAGGEGTGPGTSADEVASEPEAPEAAGEPLPEYLKDRGTGSPCRRADRGDENRDRPGQGRQRLVLWRDLILQLRECPDREAS